MSFGSKKIVTVSAKSNQKDLELIAKLANEGKIKPVIEKRYPLKQTPEALRYVSEGHARGKVVINVD
jgi:NADPH:quinone reductase-like Zn-dependent oxidoreductase